MIDRIRPVFACVTLLASLLTFGLASACGSTTESATAPDPVPDETAEATTEATATAIDTAIAQAGEDTGEGPSSGPCEGLVGSVRTDLTLPSTVGEIMVAAFEATWIDEEGFPKEGAEASAQFSVKPEPDSYWERPPVIEAEGEAAAEDVPAVDAEDRIFAPGYHLCLDEGEYVVVAFLDANNDGRIWTAGDHMGSATVTVPAEAVLSLDVVLTKKVTSSQKKKGKDGDWNSGPPESADPR